MTDIAKLFVRSPDRRRVRRVAGERRAARPVVTALMPGILGYLSCGCERTAGTSATAIASEATAQAVPTVKARAKS
jgi:hypothetical protein